MQMTSTALALVGLVQVPEDVKVWKSTPPEAAGVVHPASVPFDVSTCPDVLPEALTWLAAIFGRDMVKDYFQTVPTPR
jgi:hypothetical protein